MRNCFLLLMWSMLLLMAGGCENKVQDKEEKGTFSVCENRKVVFAPGNLATDGHDFVEHQWEYGGLFGWGTGNHAYDTTEDLNCYAVYYDWGKNFEGGWRTLSIEEWRYLLFERDDAAGKWGAGTVNDVHGLLVLPDSWRMPEGCMFRAGNNGWDGNRYSELQWSQMEKEGALFLPAGGFRWGEVVYAEGCEGMYWTSTPWDECCAHVVFFSDDTLDSAEDDRRFFGQSVRLARDCE